MIINKLLTVLAISSAISGCAGLIWESTGYDGPIIENKTMARLERSCARDLFNYRYCKMAFVNRNGDHIDMNDIRDEIDGSLFKLPSVLPWVQSTRHTKRLRYGNYETIYYSPSGKRIDKPLRVKAGRIPFSFYILTISPTVVLAVPIDPSVINRCSRQYDNSCMLSKRTEGGYYWYSREPKVSPKSFWFIPNEDIGPVYIPNNSKKYSIQLEDSVINLSSRDGLWIHTREYSNDSEIKE